MSIRDELIASLGRPPTVDEYYAERFVREEGHCRAHGHQWKRMSRQRAYPARTGTCCAHCEEIHLEW